MMRSYLCLVSVSCVRTPEFWQLQQVVRVSEAAEPLIPKIDSFRFSRGERRRLMDLYRSMRAYTCDTEIELVHVFFPVDSAYIHMAGTNQQTNKQKLIHATTATIMELTAWLFMLSFSSSWKSLSLSPLLHLPDRRSCRPVKEWPKKEERGAPLFHEKTRWRAMSEAQDPF